mmetsp:Transcript_12801/g.18894  ORF Transcript_12801/g.18894 Transcript_12801/m.18894 type:complete len:89 (+) Transcript_12801:112-378(+)|eukprot:CAMPEP_0113943168 /NCGR_PEP_ID=MMETSP1339-20121228/19572_1 /TAXON_ID=94617 /ORGANISM="Fibrocapsa japonica" /LENGTH=88 /DNA_ID=CAMNT_0000947965 /DNA_START=93 /DNA_END=359 /DNA_ORIENTATION=+ /assembly_acc=CAM_ASM_000762
MGGPKLNYPKYVWSPAGGWYANPPNWKRNTALALLGIVLSNAVVFSFSIKNEKRYIKPTGWIPSMLWCDQYVPTKEEKAAMAEAKKQG